MSVNYSLLELLLPISYRRGSPADRFPVNLAGQDCHSSPIFLSRLSLSKTSTLLSQPSLTTKQRRDKASINRTKSRTESVGRLSPIIIHAAFSLGGTRGGLSNDLTDTLYHTYTLHFFEQRPRPSDPFPPPVFIFLTIFRVNGR